jgi:hypothetical protein
VEEIADFLKKTYRGAYGIETERGQFSSFAAEEGIRIARGDGAEYDRSAQVPVSFSFCILTSFSYIL